MVVFHVIKSVHEVKASKYYSNDNLKRTTIDNENNKTEIISKMARNCVVFYIILQQR